MCLTPGIFGISAFTIGQGTKLITSTGNRLLVLSTSVKRQVQERNRSF